MQRARSVVVCLILLAACSGGHDSTGTQRSTTTTTQRHVVVACDDAGTTPAVRQLSSATGSVWIWIESVARPRVRVGSLVKIVWRITGAGTPRSHLTDPNGHAARLTFGPEEHGRSTFDHPGAEYGTGFTPSAPGCWRLTLQRGAVAGSVAFAVAR